MKTKYLTGLLLLAVACSGGQTSSGGKGDTSGESTAQLKKAAAEAHANGSASQGDVCGQHGWYGDGECDTFCQDADTSDCAVDGVVCAAFAEEPNGYCSRKADDPCISQDPDCAPSTVHPTPGAGPGTPPDPIACPAIAQLPDGVCKPDPNDPCVFYEDPDCSQNGDNGGGSGSAGANSGGGSTPAEPPGVVCAQYIEQSDGVCKRDANDPCIFQDPDCSVK